MLLASRNLCIRIGLAIDIDFEVSAKSDPDLEGDSGPNIDRDMGFIVG